VVHKDLQHYRNAYHVVIIATGACACRIDKNTECFFTIVLFVFFELIRYQVESNFIKLYQIQLYKI